MRDRHKRDLPSYESLYDIEYRSRREKWINQMSNESETRVERNEGKREREGVKESSTTGAEN